MTDKHEPTGGDGTLSWDVHTDDGEVLEEGSQPIDSFVRQWTEGLAATLGNQTVSGVTDTSGTDRTISEGASAPVPLEMSATKGTTDFGVQIGDDGVVEDVGDNALGNQLTTDIDHSSVSVGSGTSSGGAMFLDISRTFTNNTGNPVKVNEVGLVFEHRDVGGTDRYFLALRDTGSPIVEIPDGQNSSIEYTLEFKV